MSHDASSASLYGRRPVNVRAQIQADLTATVKSRDSADRCIASCLGHDSERRGGCLGRPRLADRFRGLDRSRTGELTEADVLAVVERERVELLGAADERERLGRPGDAAGLRAQAAVLKGYLP